MKETLEFKKKKYFKIIFLDIKIYEKELLKINGNLQYLSIENSTAKLEFQKNFQYNIEFSNKLVDVICFTCIFSIFY